MRKINNILVIIFIVILSIPNMGICEKFESAKDKQQREEQEIIEKERSVIGNTYTINLKGNRDNFSDFYSVVTFDYNKVIIVKENIDFIVLDLLINHTTIDTLENSYKVLLDPGNEKK